MDWRPRAERRPTASSSIDERFTERASDPAMNFSSDCPPQTESPRINGALDFIARRGDRISIRGWACELEGERVVPVARLIVYDGVRTFEVETAEHPSPRSDIGAFYRQPEASLPGFVWEIDAAEINGDLTRVRVHAIARDASSFEIHPVRREEGDDLDALRDAILGSDHLPVPGDGNEVPPAFGMHLETRESFLSCAGDYVRMMARYADLQPNHKVLDIGCGLGRIATGLTQYLGPEAEYVGFDIVASAIGWAKEHVAPLHPRFQFHHLDLQNEYYNPVGETSEARFPIEERNFDFAFLCSVFTHMHFEDVASYLVQANERLDMGGRLFATFFLMNQDAIEAVRIRRSDIAFELTNGVEHYAENEPTLSSVAHEEAAVLKLVEQSGFELMRRPLYGTWTGTRHSPGFQDIVIARKIREVGH